MHWADRYIGVKFSHGGNSVKDGFNCLTFFAHIQREHFNFYTKSDSLPKEEAARTNWIKRAQLIQDELGTGNYTEIQEPEHGCAVLLGYMSSPTHIGTYIEIDDGTKGVLHCHDPHGVMFENLSRMKELWGHISFWRMPCQN